MPADYPDLVAELRVRIRVAQVRAHLAVNRERTLLYWEIGRAIDARQHAEGWGAKVIPRLSADLRADFPNQEGFSQRNLKRMIAFYRAYPRLGERVPQAVAQMVPGFAEPGNSELMPQAVAQLAGDDSGSTLAGLGPEIVTV